MSPESLIESVGMLLAVLTPLVAIPLTVITFYLRSLREHLLTSHVELARRTERTESRVTEVTGPPL